MRLLSIILDFILPARDTEVLVARASIETIGALVEPIRTNDGTEALLPYRTQLVKALIVEAKFKDNEKAQRLLGTILADHLRESIAEHAAFEAKTVKIVPVPLSAKRVKERGYNQVERVCRIAMRSLPEIAIDTSTLARTRDTLPQTSISGHVRRTNVIGAFTAQNVNPAYTYIVIDDVTTTGATIQAAVSALQDAGATHVIPVALAH